LEKIVRCGSERADVVARAREVLAVALGASYRAAADGAHRRSAEAVAKLVARFNREGLVALEPHGRGGPKPHYDAQARERILAEARRAPDPELDGTTSWSLIEAAPGFAPRARWPAPRQHLHDWPGAPCLGVWLAGRAQLV
jgi:hypothetical protein